MTTETAYLQHGQPPGPFRTESVPVKLEFPNGNPYRWPAHYAFYEGRWRLVHVAADRTYIVYQGQKITIQIEGV